MRVQLKAARWVLDDDRVTVTPPADGSPPDWLVNWGSAKGSVTPDGSLSVEPEPWAARHYRRAVMRGAGVYRWGLWAAFGAGRAEAGAALSSEPLNGAYQFFVCTEQFFLYNCPPSTAPRQSDKARRRHFNRVYILHGGAYGASKAGRVPKRLTVYGSPVQAPIRSGFFPSAGAYVRYARAVERMWCLTARIKAAAVYQGALENLIKRGEAYRAHLARIVKPQRPPARIPRPLYARPRPPAAPLAPPALA